MIVTDTGQALNKPSAGRSRKPRNSSGPSKSLQAQQTNFSDAKAPNLEQTIDPLLQALRTWRTKDNRNWAEVEVEEFPHTFFYNLHEEEWAEKAAIWDRFAPFIQTLDQGNLHILEVGCGSGWLSHKIAAASQAKVVGLDIDPAQISLAKKVFQHPQLTFVKSDFFHTSFRPHQFDHIILMDVLPWMPDLGRVIEQAVSLLKLGGQIHLMYTPFRPSRNIAAASQAFEKYCEEKRMTSVLPFYTHHSREALEKYRIEDMMQQSWWNKVFKKSAAASWFRIVLNS